MEFKKFEELFKVKYPEGEVFRHGEFAHTRENGKVVVIFRKGGKCYDYSGSYQTILSKLGIPVYTTEDVYNIKRDLERYRKENGKKSQFFDFVLDWTEEIERLEAILEEINSGKVAVV